MSSTSSQNHPHNNSNHDNSNSSPQFQNNSDSTRKSLNLDSYFNDLPNSTTPKRSKSLCITRPVRRALRYKRLNKMRRRNTTITVPPSGDEREVDEDDEDEDDDEWVKQRWNALMDRQRLAEADVRRTILSRNRLDPLELSRWLDSEDTCTLPLPNLGVQLRMMDKE